MKVIVGKRTQYQLDVIKDSVPEAVIDGEAMGIAFPSNLDAAIERLREARKGVKGTGPSNAIGAVIKALVNNDPDVVVVVSEENEEAPAKPKKAKAPAKPKKVVPTTADGLCLCGCGDKVTREFKPGHDARYKGQLINNVLAAEADPTDGVSAQVGGYSLGVIQSRGWGAFLDKSRKALEAKAERKAKTPGSIKKGKVVDGPTVNLKQLAQARELLTRIGRYGAKAGDRQIECHPTDIPAILDGTHSAYTDEDKVELGFVSAE